MLGDSYSSRQRENGVEGHSGRPRAIKPSSSGGVSLHDGVFLSFTHKNVSFLMDLKIHADLDDNMKKKNKKK